MKDSFEDIFGDDPHQAETDGPIQAGQAEERFCIDSEERANWYLRRLGNIDAEKRRVQIQAADILRGLDADAEKLRARFEMEMFQWAHAELARRGKGKQLKLLQGAVAFRTVPASVRIVNSTDAIQYAKQHGWDVVKTVESLDSAAYRQQAEAALQEDSELLPGVEVVPERQSMSIRFPTKAGEGAAEE